MPGGERRLMVERLIRDYRADAFDRLVDENPALLDALDRAAELRDVSALDQDADTQGARRGAYTRQAEALGQLIGVA